MAGILEITPGVIVSGHRLLRMSHVTSVQLGTISPWRGPARVMAALGGALLFAVLVAPRAPGAGGSITSALLTVLIGLALVGGGVWAYLQNRDFLIIATSDGDKLQIASRDHLFMMEVLAAIREEMDPGPETPALVTVDFDALKIDRRSPPLGKPAASAAAAVIATAKAIEPSTKGAADAVVPAAAGGADRSLVRSAPTNAAPGTLVAANGPAANPSTAGAAGRDTSSGSGTAATVAAPASPPPQRSDMPRPAKSAAPVAAAPSSAVAKALNGSHAPSAVAGAGGGGEAAAPASGTASTVAATPTAASTPASAVGSASSSASAPVTASAPAAGERADVQIIAAANIDAIARLLREGRAPHLDQLMQLLDMIKRHAGADPPRNAEAREGWTAFSDYALRYLSGIEGLKREVERVGGGLKT